MLTVLGGLAEFERELIKARTMDGRERAKRAGVKMERKPILSAHQIARSPLKKGKRRIRPLPRKIIPSFAKYDFKSQMTSPIRQVYLFLWKSG